MPFSVRSLLTFTAALCLAAAPVFVLATRVAAQTTALNVDASLGNSPYALQSGTLTTGGTVVGTTSTGVFNQSGGLHSTGNAPLNLGSAATATSTYTLSGSDSRSSICKITVSSTW